MIKILLIGRTMAVLDDIEQRFQSPDLEFVKTNTLKEVREALSSDGFDHALIGGGLDLETRLEIVREIFTHGNQTKVHMNTSSGPQSYLPFVTSVLRGIL